ncbi:hypothetical protein [Methylophaga sp. OBS4]|uniref:hypothetical protein n=1 Tax=Methylophaga sp. OBS4 TaxID=2991935 RepID=UPI00225263A4|nr:hypothetical protein [Methylophaga sp. OBS4]MCX4186749.1 hypothetical protein [Methylophaga sp. OBS4]
MQTQEHNQPLKTKKPVAREKSIYAKHRQQILRQAGYLLSIELQHQRPPRSTSWTDAERKAETRLRLAK